MEMCEENKRVSRTRDQRYLFVSAHAAFAQRAEIWIGR